MLKQESLFSDNIKKILTIVSLVGIFIFGVLLVLKYGRIGFMPYDESIAFDGGWRVLSGQVPYRDFSTPDGVTVMLMQAAFFKLFGITWLAYVLHAAIINGLFGLIAYSFLRYFEISRPLSLWYAALSVVVFYAPFSTPFRDQHAFFFSLAMLAAGFWSTKIKNKKVGTFLLVGVPWLGTVALLAKQIPTLLVVPLLLMVLLKDRVQRKRIVKLILGSCAVVVMVLVVLGQMIHVDVHMFLRDYIERPLQEMDSRATKFEQAATGDQIAIANFLAKGSAFWYERYPYSTEDKSYWMFMSYGGIQLLLFLYAVWRIGSKVSKRIANKKNKDVDESNMEQIVFVATCLMIVQIIFIGITANLRENGLALLFIIVGLWHEIMLRWTKSLEKKCNIKTAPLVVLVTILFLGISFRDGVLFNVNVNKTRVAQDVAPKNPVIEQPFKSKIPALEFMDWKEGNIFQQGMTPEDIVGVYEFLTQHKGNFLLLGNASILYGITGRPSVNPALWFHQGLTVPKPYTPEFSKYESALLDNVKKYSVKYVIVEDSAKQWGNWLNPLPKLARHMKTNTCGETHYGVFEIVELCKM